MLKIRKLFDSREKVIKILAIGIVIFLLLVFLLRGVVRSTIIPAVVTLRYKNSLQDSFNTANAELNNPLLALGLSTLGSDPASCGLDTAHHFHAEVSCFVGLGGSTSEVDNGYIKAHLQFMEALQNTLTTNHWRESHSEGTPELLSQLLDVNNQQLHMGDYYGFIRFDKKFAGNSCWFSISRFDKLNALLSCSRISQIGFE